MSVSAKLPTSLEMSNMISLMIDAKFEMKLAFSTFTKAPSATNYVALEERLLDYQDARQEWDEAKSKIAYADREGAIQRVRSSGITTITQKGLDVLGIVVTSPQGDPVLVN